jgi:hypothetical protein
MKMRRQELTQILFSPQFAHDLGNGQFGKSTLSLQTKCQEIGAYFHQQSRVQTVILELHRAHMEYRFHDLPKTFNDVVLLPYVPDFSSPHRRLAEIHQIVTTRCTFTKKE